PEQFYPGSHLRTRRHRRSAWLFRARPFLEISQSCQSSPDNNYGMIRYYVTDRRQGDVLNHASRAIRNGVDMIQIREKDLPARDLFGLVSRIRDFAAGTKTRILANDRLDIALAAGIDGVHLPSNGLPAARVRPLVKLLGISTHTLDEAIDAERDRKSVEEGKREGAGWAR